VLAQRLTRRLCSKCKEPFQPEPADLERVGFPWTPGEELPVLYRPVGCSTCAKTGYKGRVALHEVMKVSETIERHTVDRVSAAVIGETARAEGMTTLRMDGWLKVLDGVTSIEEVLRVVV
jgi:type IV pilus assembly protein PilB